MSLWLVPMTKPVRLYQPFLPRRLSVLETLICVINDRSKVRWKLRFLDNGYPLEATKMRGC